MIIANLNKVYAGNQTNPSKCSFKEIIFLNITQSERCKIFSSNIIRNTELILEIEFFFLENGISFFRSNIFYSK